MNLPNFIFHYSNFTVNCHGSKAVSITLTSPSFWVSTRKHVIFSTSMTFKTWFNSISSHEIAANIKKISLLLCFEKILTTSTNVRYHQPKILWNRHLCFKSAIYCCHIFQTFLVPLFLLQSTHQSQFSPQHEKKEHSLVTKWGRRVRNLEAMASNLGSFKCCAF